MSRDLNFSSENDLASTGQMSDSDSTVTNARRTWAQAMIRRATGPLPRYGSPEWLALPDGPEKVAAVVLAAEAWAREGDSLADDLWAEVEAMRFASKQLEDAEYVARAEAHRREWSGKDWRPHPANRRAEARWSA